MTDFNRVEDEAASWVARQDRSLNFRERALFEQWLTSCTANRVAYLRLKTIWDSANKLSETKTNVHGYGLWRPSAAKVGAAASVALAACALWFCFPAVQGYLAHPKGIALDVRIARAPASEHRSLALSDGTRVYLGSNASLRTAVSGSTRSVTLEHGDAYFEVKHDDKHPFVVFAGNRKITDLGTKFSVTLNHGDIQVRVKEGSVQIQMMDKSNSAPVVAGAGDVVVAKADETLLERGTSSVLGGPAFSLLTFDSASLGDVASELNKYNRKKIYVADSAAKIRIGGSFRPDNLEGFESLLRQGFDVKVREESGGVYISR